MNKQKLYELIGILMDALVALQELKDGHDHVDRVIDSIKKKIEELEPKESLKNR